MAKHSFLLLLLCAILALVQGRGPRDNSQRKLGMSSSKKWGMKKKRKCQNENCRQGYCKSSMLDMIFVLLNRPNVITFCLLNETGIKKKVLVTQHPRPQYPQPQYQWSKYHLGGNAGDRPPTAKPHTPPTPTPPTPRPPAPTIMPSVKAVVTSPPTRAPTLLPTSIPLISVLSTRPTDAPTTVAVRNSTIPPAPTTSPTLISFANTTDEGGSGGNETESEPPADSIILRPPDKVVTTTASPTVSPTAAVEQSLEKRSIRSETLHFRASGTNDLSANEVIFFEQVERILAPYASTEIGPGLVKFLLSIVFEDDKSEVVTFGLTGQNTIYRSVFQIQSTFDLEGGSDEVDAFGRQDATAVLKAVFQDDLLDRLLLALSNNGVRISNIAVYDPNEDTRPDGGDEAEATEPPRDIDPSEPRSKDNSRRNTLLITLFSGALVIFALSVAIFLNNRRRRRYYHYGEKVAQASRASGSQGPPSLSGTSEGGGSKVQRAAGASKSYDSRDFLRRDATVASGLEPMLDDIENTYSYYTSPSHEEEKFEMEPLDPKHRALPSAAVDPNAIAGATLTALDGTGSVNQLNETYPEFEMFAGLKQPGSPGSPQTQYDIPPSSPMNPDNNHSPISPYWSVDGAVSGPEDEDYQNDRRRWQDEANDIGLASAPDHNSGGSTSDAYNSSSEESEKGWSDENVSEDGRKVQILPSVD
eukprot:scaffold7850_cov171-Amphora_coffeaeformis.AAC.2